MLVGWMVAPGDFAGVCKGSECNIKADINGLNMICKRKRTRKDAMR